MINLDQRANGDVYQEFANLIIETAETIGFKVSARGWCYILEGMRLIDKDQFDKAEKWINTCRKSGLLPVDLVAADSSRSFNGIETPSNVSPVEDFGQWIDAAVGSAERFDVDWWRDEKYYIQMLVEKVDLVTLFGPVCAEHHIPIANSKGWSSILQRAEYSRRFKEAEDRGLICVLLYCGDHDPDGLRISETLLTNLEQVSGITWDDGELGFDPCDLIIERFGLNFDFIEANGFTWIDNLITGSGKNLADPSHPNHGQDYVQEYLEKVGARKCEANVLVTNPQAARDLCLQAIERYLDSDALERFAGRRQQARDYVNAWMGMTGTGEHLAAIRQAVDIEGDLMGGLEY